jgi:hypothetical protein
MFDAEKEVRDVFWKLLNIRWSSSKWCWSIQFWLGWCPLIILSSALNSLIIHLFSMWYSCFSSYLTANFVALHWGNLNYVFFEWCSMLRNWNNIVVHMWKLLASSLWRRLELLSYLSTTKYIPSILVILIYRYFVL